MKNLNFGCKRSDFLVTNSKKDWFIQCRFYEPDRKTPFTYRRRLNRFKNEKERKQIEKSLLKNMTELLDERDYNPRTKQFMFSSGVLNPNMSLSEALQLALDQKSYSTEHLKIVQSDLNKFSKAAEKTNLHHLKIKDVELLHIKTILNQCNLSNYGYNKAKKHLSSLFTDIVDAGCVKVNPCTGIKAKTHVTARKDIFTDKELSEIKETILRDVPHFYNFYQIFYMSGCRVPEILGLKCSDVDLDRQEFEITLKKGAMYIREKRAVISEALPFWEDQMNNAQKNDFIFSKGFNPGSKPLNRDYIYKFWKDKIGIKTIYTLKHTFLDKVESLNYSAQIAAGHRKDATTAIYTVGREKRRLEAQKEIKL